MPVSGFAAVFLEERLNICDMNKQALNELTQKCTECIEAWKKENWHKPLDIDLGCYVEQCRMADDDIQYTYEEVWDGAPEDDTEVQKAILQLERRLMVLNYDGQDVDRIYYGQRIANLRKGRGMTQQQLANVVGVSREHIARIEAGKYSVGLDILVKVAKALGMELEFV